MRGEALFATGKRDKAIEVMMASLADLPPSLASEYTMIDLLLKNNQIDQAIDRLRNVITIFPDDPRASDYLAAITEKRGRTSPRLRG
jgi:Flp pilus assembly protein TadD